VDYARGAQEFAAIIVHKDTGFPGEGFFCDDELPPSLRRPYSMPLIIDSLQQR
jgi:hypothetical protein